MDKILFNEQDIKNKIQQLSSDISYDYKIYEPPIVIGVLKGAFMFTSDLVKKLSIPVIVDFTQVRSYKGTESSGKIEIIKDIDLSIKGKNIILVDTIVDTGYTLNFLVSYFYKKQADSVKTVVLLNKKCKRKIEVDIDYYGWEIDDKFIVGYGTDYNQLYRELPYIKELK